MKGCGDEGGVVMREVWRGTLVQKTLSLLCLLVGPFIPCQNS